MSETLTRPARIDILKWVASISQILGYGATGLGWAAWALPFFLLGVVGWAIVGLAWRDRALILIHIVALAALLGGAATR
nr:DUF6552 family protein [Thalassococcus arenae]